MHETYTELDSDLSEDLIQWGNKVDIHSPLKLSLTSSLVRQRGELGPVIYNGAHRE